MARSVQQIQNTILTAIQANPVLSQLNSTSQVSLYNLFSYIISVSQNTEEVLNDAFVQQVENVVNVLAPATAPWIQEQAFLFQYSATTPQIIQFSTQSFTPFYPVVTPTYQIITNCSVSINTAGYINVKVAQGATAGTGIPVPLSTNQLTAFQYYMNQIKPAGVTYFCTSQQGDRLFSQFTITYNFAYAGTIRAALLAAYNGYLQSVSYGGSIEVVDIVLILRAVTGVINVVCTNMTARTYATPFGSGATLVSSSAWITSTYTTISGYIVGEDTAGNSFLDQLTLLTP